MPKRYSQNILGFTLRSHYVPLKGNRGFTLIELLIVVAIIAVLTAVGMAVFGAQQKNARDARRKADINSIADALETKYDNGYPNLDESFFSSGQVPQDPLNSKQQCGKNASNVDRYCYYCSVATIGGFDTCASGSIVAKNVPVAGLSFKICANLETTSGIGGVNYYCRQNRQ